MDSGEDRAMMNKKDYIAIAEVLRICDRASVAEQRRQIICGLANLFQRENPHFDSLQFLLTTELPR